MNRDRLALRIDLTGGTPVPLAASSANDRQLEDAPWPTFPGRMKAVRPLAPRVPTGMFGSMGNTAGQASFSTDYAERFDGVARLVGRAGLERLQAAHVCVVGVGGVGSWVAEGLARSGIGALTLVDLDDVCVTNVNRQLPALDGQIGRPKVTVLKERIHLINPACRVEPRLEFFTASSATRLLEPPYDYVVDAVDRMSHKALLIAGCRQRGIPVLSIGAAGGRRDATKIQAGDIGEAGDELLRQVRKKLRREHEFSAGAHRGITRMGVRCVWSDERPVFPWADGTCGAEPEPGSDLRLDCASGFGTAVFVTGVFGFVAAGEVVRALAGSAPAGVAGREEVETARGRC